MKKPLILLFAALLPLFAGAQSAVSYSLPQTVLVFNVEAQKETFYAGPYARYAQKYLGVNAELYDRVSYTVTSVKMITGTEADQFQAIIRQYFGQSVTIHLARQGR